MHVKVLKAKSRLNPVFTSKKIKYPRFKKLSKLALNRTKYMSRNS